MQFGNKIIFGTQTDQPKYQAWLDINKIKSMQVKKNFCEIEIPSQGHVSDEKETLWKNSNALVYISLS